MKNQEKLVRLIKTGDPQNILLAIGLSKSQGVEVARSLFSQLEKDVFKLQRALLPTDDGIFEFDCGAATGWICVSRVTLPDTKTTENFLVSFSGHENTIKWAEIFYHAML